MYKKNSKKNSHIKIQKENILEHNKKKYNIRLQVCFAPLRLHVKCKKIYQKCIVSNRKYQNYMAYSKCSLHSTTLERLHCF